MMRTNDMRGRRVTDLGAPTRKNRLATAGWGMLLGMLSLTACDSLLEVENPNSLVQEDLSTPSSAGALANGALSTVARAAGQALLLHSASSDELVFTGSRDAWIQLQEGDVRDPANEFSDAAWPFVAEGRWMADEAVRILTGFNDEGTLGDPTLLAQSKLYSAVMRTLIADLWEDFVLSDRQEEQPPVGPENMLGFYDYAEQQLGDALAIAQAEGDAGMEAQILAQRARTRHARAVREKLTPAGSTPADPLVNDAGANSDAMAALALVDDTWQFRFNYSSGTVSNQWGSDVNERLELRPSDSYVEATENDKQVESVTLQDPIDNVTDPALEDIILEAVAARNWPPMTIVSARELLLILAEAALAEDDDTGFTTYINRIRTMDGLTDYTGQVAAEDLLRHHRMGGLYLTGRRLNDHYRWGSVSPLWNPNASASTRPGTLFPIAQIERTSNCFLVGTC
jgi:starch-binding outer membrane protein, SusD/RagB family